MTAASFPGLILFTRYSVRSAKFMKAANILSEEVRERWFRLRTELFKSITLHSIRDQSLQPTRWYLLLSDGDQELYDECVGELENWIVPIFLRSGESVAQACYSRMLDDIGAMHSILISRIDNDDAVHRNFYKTITESVFREMPDRDRYILFRHGCRWDGSKVQAIDYPNNPFLTIASKNWRSTRPNPLAIDHTKVLDHDHIFIPSSAESPMWLQSIHSSNASNSFILNQEIPRAIDHITVSSAFGMDKNASATLIRIAKLWDSSDHSKTKMTNPKAMSSDTLDQNKPIVPALDTKTARARRLNEAAQIISAESYLEIGVCTGATFFNVDIARKVGVDPHFRFDIVDQQDRRATFCTMTSNEYFASVSPDEKFDLIFVDGLHTFEQTLIDFNSCMLMTDSRSVIIIDDTLPKDVFGSLPDARRAFKFRKASGGKSLAWHGDVYKLIVYIHDFIPTLSYCTFANGGNPQTMVWRESRTEVTPVCGNLERISRLDYFWLIENISILNLLPESDALLRLRTWRESIDIPLSGT
jgi:Putative rhamnosyl transferase/Methyltransferase domain